MPQNNVRRPPQSTDGADIVPSVRERGGLVGTLADNVRGPADEATDTIGRVFKGVLMRDHDERLDFERLLASRGVHGRFEPNADVLLDESGRAVLVHLELAGADADSLRVTIDDDDLLVTGRRAARDVSRDASLLRKEIPYGEFFKRIRLPVAIRDDGAAAVYRDGILTIALPFAESKTMPIVRTTIRMTVRRTPA